MSPCLARVTARARRSVSSRALGSAVPFSAPALRLLIASNIDVAPLLTALDCANFRTATLGREPWLAHQGGDPGFLRIFGLGQPPERVARLTAAAGGFYGTEA